MCKQKTEKEKFAGVETLKERIKVKFKDGEETFFKRFDLKDVKVLKRARKEEELDAESEEDLKELKKLEKLDRQDKKIDK